MAEQVEFVLSAKDNASAVFKKTSAEMQILNHQVSAGAKEAKGATDAFDKMAKVLGVGWVGDAARDMKNLSDSVSKSSGALSQGGASALAMKAGIVALVAVGSFQFGKMIGDWIFDTQRFRDEFDAAMEKSRKQIIQLGKTREKSLSLEFSDIKEFGGSAEEQQQQARALRDRIKLDRDSQEQGLAAAQKKLKAIEREAFQSIRGSKARAEQAKIEILQYEEQLKASERTYEAIKEFTTEDSRTALRAEKEKQQAFEARRTQLEQERDFAKMTREEIALAKIQLEGHSDEHTAILIAIEKENQAYQAQQAVLKQIEEGRQKALQLQEKDNQKAIDDARKALQAAQDTKLTIDQPGGIQGTDSRLLTQQTTGPSPEEKQLAIAEKQAKTAEAQKALDELMLKQLELIAQRVGMVDGGITI